MGFETPRLDDRAFADLVEEARSRIALYTPEWTDHNLSDPGMTLIELFAWMTDIVLYRLNRVPDKNFIKFMELVGMRLHEAEPASVPITFWLTTPQDRPVTIRAGTEVATQRTQTQEAIVFTTDENVEVQVPQLAHLLTSSGGPVEGRSFNSYDVRQASAGFERIPVFPSEPPQAGDALYLGFEEDLSHHIIGINLIVEAAEGAGINPDDPPYTLEVLGKEANQEWVRAPVETGGDSTRGLNANGTIRVHLPAMRRAVRNNTAAYWLRLRLTDRTDRGRYGVSPTVQKLTVSAWGVATTATNVTRHKDEVLGRSDGTPGQTFFLQNAPIVSRTPEETIIIRRGPGRDERWTEVADFASSTSEDRHYVIDSQTGEVRFGPALPQRDGEIRMYGALPEKGAMIVMRSYRSGGGKEGNVAANTLVVHRSANPLIARVSNLEAASGGQDAENLDNARLRVPGHLRSLDRAVTGADFEYLTKRAVRGQIGRVICLQAPYTNPGEIKIVVIPHVPNSEQYLAPESLELSEDLRDTIRAYLDQRRLLATQLDVIMPNYQWVDTEVRYHAAQHTDPEAVTRAIEKRLYRFINPITGGMDEDGWPFGRDLFVADVMAVLLTVPGVEFVRSVKLFPVTYDRGDFTQGAETPSIGLSAEGVIVSRRHRVIEE